MEIIEVLPKRKNWKLEERRKSFNRLWTSGESDDAKWHSKNGIYWEKKTPLTENMVKRWRLMYNGSFNRDHLWWKRRIPGKRQCSSNHGFYYDLNDTCMKNYCHSEFANNCTLTSRYVHRNIKNEVKAKIIILTKFHFMMLVVYLCYYVHATNMIVYLCLTWLRFRQS